MKSISKILGPIVVMLPLITCNAQIKNAETETVKIYGNCGMCEKTIEKAGNIKNIAQVDWNKETKMASITYDNANTNSDEILKRIALSGYDNEKFLAPNEAYSNLPECCQYERNAKLEISKIDKSEPSEIEIDHQLSAENMNENQLQPVFDNYFELKNALVNSDGTSENSKGKALFFAINDVKIEKLTTKEHVVWMKIVQNLKEDAKVISETKDVNVQRDYFDTLSNNMFELFKVSEQKTPTYFQYCPMANDGKGANWISKESAIKNPYFGSKMLKCGKTINKIE